MAASVYDVNLTAAFVKDQSLFERDVGHSRAPVGLTDVLVDHLVDLVEHFFAVIDLHLYLIEDFDSDFLNITKSGMLIIKKGYAWDGASGPCIDTFSLENLLNLLLIKKSHIKKSKSSNSNILL